MALNKAGLESALLAHFSNPDNSAADSAAAIATAIDDYVKTATVTTTVTGTLPSGPVAAAGSGSLS